MKRANNTMPELTVSLHVHTTYSDGTGTYAEIAQAALETGVDIVLLTDHNVLVQRAEKYYEENQNRVLFLMGEEVHDRTRAIQKNHLLVFGAEKEMVGKAENPQALVDAIAQAGGMSF
ncbi:MAG: hypothetical protein B6243_01195, partial [Anaerolineaceae bacterium 4572_5.2]